MSNPSYTKCAALSTALLMAGLLLIGLLSACGQATTQPVAITKVPRLHATKATTVSKARALPRTLPPTRVVVDIHVRPTRLSQRVNTALRADRRLNGSHAYSTSNGGVVLYGRVFDKMDRCLAERTASDVHGVKYVVNDLKTSTGQWMKEQARINNAFLQSKSLQGVSAQVIGHQVYLSGQVSSESDRTRAAQLASSLSQLRVVNFIWVVPGPIFSMAKSN